MIQSARVHTQSERIISHLWVNYLSMIQWNDFNDSMNYLSMISHFFPDMSSKIILLLGSQQICFQQNMLIASLGVLEQTIFKLLLQHCPWLQLLSGISDFIL